MEHYIFCDERLPEQPYASRYEIIVRCCLFQNGKLLKEPVCWIANAKYAGDGYWEEYLTDHPTALDGEGDRIVDCLSSSGMTVDLEDEDPDAFDVDVDEDLKIGYDVVAYYPLPDSPDLTNLRPMKHN